MLNMKCKQGNNMQFQVCVCKQTGLSIDQGGQLKRYILSDLFILNHLNLTFKALSFSTANKNVQKWNGENVDVQVLVISDWFEFQIIGFLIVLISRFTLNRHLFN